MMIKKLLYHIVLIAGCCLTLLYAVASLTAFISPLQFSFSTFLGLAFPYLLVAMLCWVCLSMFLYKKWRWVFVLILFLGYKNAKVVIAFRHKSTPIAANQKQGLRVLSWNVQDFLDSQVYTDTPGNKRRDMLAFIRTMQPDVFCVQDFVNYTGEAFKNNINDVKKAGNFGYYYFSKDYEKLYPYGHFVYGSAIFSKYPITDSGRIAYFNYPNSEALMYVNIQVNNAAIRVYNTHLQSMFLNAVLNDDFFQDEFISPQLAFLKTNPSTMSKLSYYDKIHAQQASLIQQELATCKIPFVFCGDLNSVPSSYTYHTIAKNLQDAFVEKGFGIGSTYPNRVPTLRIDVTLCSKDFTVMAYQSPQIYASDHFPVLCELKLNKQLPQP